MLRRGVQQLANSLIEQLHTSSSAAVPSCSSWQALRGICGTGCTQRKLFPPTVHSRPDDGAGPGRLPRASAVASAAAAAAATVGRRNPALLSSILQLPPKLHGSILWTRCATMLDQHASSRAFCYSGCSGVGGSCSSCRLPGLLLLPICGSLALPAGPVHPAPHTARPTAVPQSRLDERCGAQGAAAARGGARV